MKDSLLYQTKLSQMNKRLVVSRHSTSKFEGNNIILKIVSIERCLMASLGKASLYKSNNFVNAK